MACRRSAVRARLAPLVGARCGIPEWGSRIAQRPLKGLAREPRWKCLAAGWRALSRCVPASFPSTSRCVTLNAARGKSGGHGSSSANANTRQQPSGPRGRGGVPFQRTRCCRPFAAPAPTPRHARPGRSGRRYPRGGGSACHVASLPSSVGSNGPGMTPPADCSSRPWAAANASSSGTGTLPANTWDHLVSAARISSGDIAGMFASGCGASSPYGAASTSARTRSG